MSIYHLSTFQINRNTSSYKTSKQYENSEKAKGSELSQTKFAPNSLYSNTAGGQ